MAGVRSRPLAGGKYQGWYGACDGPGEPMRRKFFTGTRDKKETLRIAQRLEDEAVQIRLKYRPAPKAPDRYQNRPFADFGAEYLAWGESKGGRGGRPWGRRHAVERRRFLKWWQVKLNLQQLGDLADALPYVERALHGLEQRDHLSGKTLQSYADGLAAFCRWCVDRGYIEADPLAKLTAYDTTPKTQRRAMTPAEIHDLLGACAEHRRLLYEIAFCSGLRAGELRALEGKHLDSKHSGLHLSPAWTKNRKPGFQPLPAPLMNRLAAFHQAGRAKELYRSFGIMRRKAKTGAFRVQPPQDPVLYVPSHTARDLGKDLTAAGISIITPAGKLDFHACRVAYTTFVFEAGATLKEAQTLVRHQDPQMTANIYARARESRLREVAENVGRMIVPPLKEVSKTKHRKAAGGEAMSNE